MQLCVAKFRTGSLVDDTLPHIRNLAQHRQNTRLWHARAQQHFPHLFCLARTWLKMVRLPRPPCAALLLLLAATSLPATVHGWWPWVSVENTVPEDLPEEIEDKAHLPAKFEVSNAEQKFLAEAQKYLQLSPLEKCQHSVSIEAI